MKYLTAFFVLAACGCVVASAQTWKDGPFGGYVFGGDVDQAGFAFGYQVGYEANRAFSLEFSGSWHEDKSARLAPRLPTVADGTSIDLDLISLVLTGRLAGHPTRSVTAYLGGGFGYYVLDFDSRDIREAAAPGVGFIDADAGDSFGIHYALGAEVLLTSHWDVFAEFRHVFLEPKVEVTFAPDRDTPPTSSEDDFSYDHMLIRLGVNYRF